MDIALGMRFITKEVIIDTDENGQERVSPAGLTAEIISVEDYPAQGLTYGFEIESTGASGYMLESEVQTTVANWL